MTSETEQQKTPKWLKRLEKESWQAELLISGLALYGTLYLPEFVYILSDTLIDRLPVKYYLAGYAISFFYLFGISILTTFFIIHFIIRAYWVGLIGLNSIYPNGYKIEDGYYSPIFSRLIAKKLPTVKETIKAVDKQCSGMFAGAFVFMLMYGMMSVSFSILLVIYMLTHQYIPTPIWIALAVVFTFITFAVSIFGFFGKNEKYRNNEKLQKYFFVASYIYGNIITPFIYKPLNQIIFTFQSNAKSASASIKVAFPFIIIASGLSMHYLEQSNIGILIAKGSGDQINIFDNSVYANNYLDQFDPNQNIFIPVIDSDIISGPFIKLFIPVLSHESYIQDLICGEYQEDEIIKDEADRIRERKHFLNCAKQYISVFLNEAPYQGEFLGHNHKQGNRFGILTYIPTSIISPGKNTIRVQKIKNKESEIFDNYRIKFWFSG